MSHQETMKAPAGMDLCPIMPTYGAPSVMFVKGQGCTLWDNHDNEYLDFLAGIAVCSLGHSHPAVTAAIAEQAGKLLHVSNLYANEYAWDVASTLDRLIRSGYPDGGEPGQVFFANSGAEAIEASLKLARKWGGRGRHVVITAMRSFHGRTLGALAATGQPEKQEPFHPMPDGFKHVVLNDIDELNKLMDDTVAAVLLEPIQGEGGVNPLADGYLADVRQLCNDRGALLMMDEIQMGLGRCGEWFAHHTDGVPVDVVTMAKALGNGVPIGACWARGEVAASFKPGEHASTFGGQPLATAAAKATLHVLEEMDAPAVAKATGKLLTDKLEAQPWCDHVRGRGLLLACEITTDALAGRNAGELMGALMAAGLVVGGSGPTALRLAPPLIVSEAEVDKAVSIMSTVIAGGS